MGKRRREERVQTIMAKAIEQYQCQRTENISLMSVFKIIHTVCVWMNATYWTYALEKRQEPVNTHLSSSGSIHSSPGGLRVPLKISWRGCTLLNNHSFLLNTVSNRRKLCFLMATYIYNHALGTLAAADDRALLASAHQMTLHLIGNLWFKGGVLQFDLHKGANHHIWRISSLKRTSWGTVSLQYLEERLFSALPFCPCCGIDMK